MENDAILIVGIIAYLFFVSSVFSVIILGYTENDSEINTIDTSVFNLNGENTVINFSSQSENIDIIGFKTTNNWNISESKGLYTTDNNYAWIAFPGELKENHETFINSYTIKNPNKNPLKIVIWEYYLFPINTYLKVDIQDTIIEINEQDLITYYDTGFNYNLDDDLFTIVTEFNPSTGLLIIYDENMIEIYRYNGIIEQHPNLDSHGGIQTTGIDTQLIHLDTTVSDITSVIDNLFGNDTFIGVLLRVLTFGISESIFPWFVNIPFIKLPELALIALFIKSYIRGA